LAQAAGDGRTAAAAQCELGYVEAMAGRRPAAAGYLADALAAAEDGSDLARIHGVIAFNLVDWGRLDEAFAHYGLSLDHARAAGNRRREMWSLGLGGWGHVVAGRFGEAAAWLGDCLDLADEQNWIAFRPWPVAVLAEARLHQQHRPADLRPALEVAFALSCQIADPCWEGAVARSLALTCAAEDDLGRALEWLGEARRRVVRDIDGYVALQVEIRASEAQIHRRAGHGDIADALGREWLALAARTHMDRHVALAAAFIAAS
jgi:tetratricopeptide (TPR) repeat protein